jgi:hypothetical protein
VETFLRWIYKVYRATRIVKQGLSFLFSSEFKDRSIQSPSSYDTKGDAEDHKSLPVPNSVASYDTYGDTEGLFWSSRDLKNSLYWIVA